MTDAELRAERQQCDERIHNQRERITQLESEAALATASRNEQMAIIERLTAENKAAVEIIRRFRLLDYRKTSPSGLLLSTADDFLAKHGKGE